MKPEPCEFTSAELIQMAITQTKDAIADAGRGFTIGWIVTHLEDIQQHLVQAQAQLEHNNGAATPFPEPKDPWAWEDPETFCPS